MLIFLRHELAYLATPKTGTTAVEMALKSQAEIVFAKSRKHMTAARYANKVAPFLKDTFGVRPASVAVMRDPVDQIRSWYKYRSQSRLDGSEVSTRGISFDQFVREVIADAPKRAQIGQQFRFLTHGDGRLAVDHLFAYEAQPQFLAFLSERLGEPIALESRNVSPPITADISDATLSLLHEARASDFELHNRLMSAGGYLAVTPDAQGQAPE